MNCTDLKGKLERVVRFKKKGHAYGECAALLASAVKASEDLDNFIPMVKNVCRSALK